MEIGRPTLPAMLVFRYGFADEPIAEAGWQHLLEHAALDGGGGGALHVNGQVSLLETAFQLHAPPSEVAQVLGDLCSWLTDQT